jgi:hypothetical protein
MRLSQLLVWYVKWQIHCSWFAVFLAGIAVSGWWAYKYQRERQITGRLYLFLAFLATQEAQKRGAQATEETEEGTKPSHF